MNYFIITFPKNRLNSIKKVYNNSNNNIRSSSNKLNNELKFEESDEKKLNEKKNYKNKIHLLNIFNNHKIRTPY